MKNKTQQQAIPHTPGPWVAHPARQSYGTVIEVTHGVRNSPLATVHVWNGMSRANEDSPKLPNAEANARLIAAAPDLLASLQELCEAADSSDAAGYGTLSTRFVREVVSAAIAKAQGRAS